MKNIKRIASCLVFAIGMTALTIGVVVPMINYRTDLSYLNSGIVVDKSIEYRNNLFGQDDTKYCITIEDDSEQVSVPWFMSFWAKPEKSIYVTENEYEQLSVGDYYKE